MKKNDIFYKSADNITTIHAVEWVPDRDIRAILQICHGMKEFIERYDFFASFCAENGYLVVGNDHLGHGKSVVNEDSRGFFAEKDGNMCLIKDIDMLRRLTKEKYPGLPYFMLGHSMGSFLLRQYITLFGDGLAGSIIMGTGYYSDAKLISGMQLCRAMASKKGWHYRSSFVNSLSEGAYNQKFGEKGGNEWLTKEAAVVKAYNDNADIIFTFTLNGYYNMYAGMRKIIKKKDLEKMNKSMPVLFVSGGDDPVGDFGKGPVKVYNSFKKIGMEDVTIRLFEHDRHEILNETDREDVYKFILNWLEGVKQNRPH